MKSVVKLVLLGIFLIMTTNTYSQLIFSAQVRPRAEFRNGFGTLSDSTTNPAFSISQRTRFDLSYNRDKVQLFISLQDIRTWGDVRQLNASDINGLTVHQAWGQYKINDVFALRVGRQEIIYDDHRIFGNVGWAQQARSHDLALLKFTKNKWKVDVGLAFNQDAQKLFETTYTTQGNYQNMQYVWAHKDMNKLGVSFLFLNQGLQYLDTANSNNNTIRYSQTIGFFAKENISDFVISGNFYYQMGKDKINRNLGGYLIGVDAMWLPKEKSILAGLGFEIQSGNDLNYGLTPDSVNNKAFSPFFGTNHKFNGYLDYFYVGNHFNSVGLIDLNATIGYRFKKSKLVAQVHYFLSSGAIIVASPTTSNWETKSSSLGTEIDITYAVPLGESTNLKMGYSQMFASESMEIIKNRTGGAQTTNNWAWVMLTFKPQLFKHDYKKTASTVTEVPK